VMYSHPGEHLAVASNGLSKRFGSVKALENVDLRVPDGAVYVIAGANGAGKSTLFKLLMNLERPDAGGAEVFGLDTGADGPLARAQIGYMPERHEPGYGWMTCRRLLRHVATYYPTWDDDYAAGLSRAFDIDLDRKVSALSKGHARRLQLIMALAHRPALLLLDEPTDGLDPVVRKRALETLTSHLADTPTTVLMSTHQLHEVESLADHLGVLREGRLVAQMSRDDLRRTVRRYRVNIPAGWQAPRDIQPIETRQSSTGREIEWTVVGDERELAERFAAAGARVDHVAPVGLEDAAVAFLAGDTVR
jgi:ABC-2 type transport system ATP-binding protein